MPYLLHIPVLAVEKDKKMSEPYPTKMAEEIAQLKEELNMRDELDFEDRIVLALLPYIFKVAEEDCWAADDKAGDQWVEQVGFEAYKYARRIMNMKHAQVKKDE